MTLPDPNSPKNAPGSSDPLWRPPVPDEDATMPLDAEDAATTRQTPGATIPRQIGHYSIRHVLSSGGMGTVYVAVQEKPRRTVAVKVMRQGIASRSALRRFEFESQILARLKHPYIAEVYEADTHDDGSGGVPFFAMEYVPNARTITEYVRAKSLGTRERLALFAKVCEAVHHGHTKGIIHRDLKPGNILVDGEGNPKIIDFGVARATDSDLALTTLQTDIGQLIGTLQYMSPEQCEADPHDIDTRSDVYALGVVLYELLTERLPYDVSRAAIHEAARIIREDPPTRPSTLDKTLRGDVETITLKALEKERDRRYRSAEALAEDVGRYLRSEPIQARRPSVGYQLSRFARRHRELVAATVVVLALLVASLAVTSVLLVRAVRAESRVERELARVLSLSDIRLVSDFAAEARELWPAYPERVGDLEEWLSKARDLYERLPTHEAALKVLRQQAIPGNWDTAETPALKQTWRFADASVRWQHDVLTELVERLRAFGAPGTGAIADVERRVTFARTIAERTTIGSEARAEWSSAIASIADRRSCPEYDGLVVRPQLGLLPLDRNPQTGLWEFWHVQTGERPEPNPAWPDGAPNRWVLTGDSGLVFVLIPGGKLTTGVQPPKLGVTVAPTPNGLAVTTVVSGTLAERIGIVERDILQVVNGEEVQDSASLRVVVGRIRAGDTVTVSVLRDGTVTDLAATAESVGLESDVGAMVAPFFMSKYEMTQGQWARFVGVNPSFYADANVLSAVSGRLITGVTATYPVEQVSWEDADQVLRRLALVLPTENQWEYAWRATTALTWKRASGAAPGSRARTANASSTNAGPINLEVAGGAFLRAVPSPVGSLAPNPFGLHDLDGNVIEWCRDSFTEPVQIEGRRQEGLRRVIRGRPYLGHTTTNRDGLAPASRYDTLGLRPARVITE